MFPMEAVNLEPLMLPLSGITSRSRTRNNSSAGGSESESNSMYLNMNMIEFPFAVTTQILIKIERLCSSILNTSSQLNLNNGRSEFRTNI